MDQVVINIPRTVEAAKELQIALEEFKANRIGEGAIDAITAKIRVQRWTSQLSVGHKVIHSNDFALFHPMLDMSLLIGAVPQRFAHLKGLGQHVAMACGIKDVPAMEVAQWFDTNQDYVVPELTGDMSFKLLGNKPLLEFLEACHIGITTRPVIIGPLTWLVLGKAATTDFDPLQLLPRLLPVYVEILSGLLSAGVEVVQIDEPILARELTPLQALALKQAIAWRAYIGPKIVLASDVGATACNMRFAASLPIAGLHIETYFGD